VTAKRQKIILNKIEVEEKNMSGKNKKYNFNLKKPEDVVNTNLFAVTNPEDKKPYDDTKNIRIDKLKPFKNHPFKLYEGQRFEDMVESIKEHGVLLPIIVRLIDNDNYEILSGHNRTEAAKAAGLEYIPAVVREDLSEDEAMLIVTETNLRQRSFADLSHSERAVTLAMHHEAIKRQGKRTDLINEIEDLLNVNGATSAPMARKLESREKVGQEYDLSKDTVARYLRVNRLSDELKNRVDNDEIAIRAAVEISYLSEEEQNILNMTLDNPAYKLDMKKAAQLREFSAKKTLTADAIEEILTGSASTTIKPQKITLKTKSLKRYFTPEQTAEEIEAEIFEALAFFRANKPNSTN
jgi:ParB family chromosome partitioning protein